MASSTPTTQERAPVIAVMGHIDHGKSKLLDYIREENVVEGETGGITQHLGAYEVKHDSKEHGTKKITFLDTPGHEAFRAIRSRGAEVADIAILVVAADEGVKPQTVEALETIRAAGIPFIVAINKIDKPEADVNQAKISLSEHDILIEEYGGQVPAVPISAISGEGIDDLLDMILLVAELEEISGDTNASLEAIVIEANVDTKKGISATLIIKNGCINQGEFVVVGNTFAPVRIMENFTGAKIEQACFSMPIRIVGFNALPTIGERAHIVDSKKHAEALARENHDAKQKPKVQEAPEEGGVTLPLIIRADVSGSLEAILHEIDKIETENVHIRYITKDAGNISENDIKYLAGTPHSTIIGFNVAPDPGVSEMAERSGVEMKTFDVIYEIREWLEKKMRRIKPTEIVDEVHARAKIQKVFSRSKNKQVVGGKVITGKLGVNNEVKIVRRDEAVGRGKLIELQVQKAKTSSVDEGNEFGAMVETRREIAPGDTLEAFVRVEK